MVMQTKTLHMLFERGNKMTMIELFASKYAGGEKNKTLKSFTKRIRWFGDSLTMSNIELNDISQIDLKKEREAGLIRWEPNIFKGISGYTLTTKGIKEIYRRIK